jgi:hypothetical protein
LSEYGIDARVISDLDIWRAANLLKHGADAEFAAIDRYVRRRGHRGPDRLRDLATTRCTRANSSRVTAVPRRDACVHNSNATASAQRCLGQAVPRAGD